jgi:hypothetical protein
VKLINQWKKLYHIIVLLWDRRVFDFPSVWSQNLIEIGVEQADRQCRLDLKSGFYHIAMAPDSTKYTSFVTPMAQFENLRMPFGLTLNWHTGSGTPGLFTKMLSIYKPEGLGGIYRSRGIFLSISPLLIPHDSSLWELTENFIQSGFFKLRVHYTQCVRNVCIVNKKKVKFIFNKRE